MPYNSKEQKPSSHYYSDSETESDVEEDGVPALTDRYRYSPEGQEEIRQIMEMIGGDVSPKYNHRLQRYAEWLNSSKIIFEDGTETKWVPASEEMQQKGYSYSICTKTKAKKFEEARKMGIEFQKCTDIPVSIFVSGNTNVRNKTYYLMVTAGKDLLKIKEKYAPDQKKGNSGRDIGQSNAGDEQVRQNPLHGRRPGQLPPRRTGVQR